MSLLGEPATVFFAAMAPGLDAEARERLGQRVGFHEREEAAGSGRLFDGVREALEELVGLGFDLAVCSNGRPDYVDGILSACGIRGLFRAVQGNETQRTKSENLKRLLDETGRPWAVMVGDRFHDFEAARDSAVPSIGAGYGYGGDEVGAADFRAGSPGEVVDQVTRCAVFMEIDERLGRSRFIGLNGIDNSGKTEFADALAAYLRSRGREVELIHLDDFHNPRAVRRQGADELDAYIRNAFDFGRLERELLAPARAGGRVDVDLPVLDLERDAFTERRHYRIGPDTVVIVEGTLLFREPIDGYLDLRVFLDVEFDEALRRAERRDVPRYGPEFLERYRRKYFPVQRWYMATHRPAERCDVLIDNDDHRRPRVAWAREKE